MLIDANAYIGEWPFRGLDGSAGTVVERMDEHGIDRAVVSALQAPMYKNPQVANRELMADIEGYEDRFVPFATIDPTYPAWDADLEESISELDMRGVRLFPAYHDYLLSKEPVIEFARACAERDIPLMICAVLQDQRQRHPRVKLREANRKSYTKPQVDAMLELLRESPDTDIIVGNARRNAARINREASPRRERGWFYNADRSGDLYFTLDGLVMSYVAEGEDIIKAVGPEQILFGSRLPLDYVSERGSLKLEHLPVNDDERELIRSGNVRSLLE